MKIFSKILNVHSAVDFEFFAGGSLGTNFFCHAKCKIKKIFGIFSSTECSGLNFSEEYLGQLFLFMLNLWSKIF